MPKFSEVPYVFPFGKHKGEDIKTIPDSYLEWVLVCDLENELRKLVKKELCSRDKTGRHIVDDSDFRNSKKRYHPDYEDESESCLY